jgi:hypothetical protein
MDFLTHVFLESAPWLGGFCFCLFSFVVLARRRWSERAAAYALPLTLLIVAVLFLVQWLVVTQREQIWASLDAFIRAVERQDDARIRGALSDAYQGEGMDREAILSFIVERLRRLRVYDSRVSNREVDIDGDRAALELVAGATVSVDGGVGQWHMGRWRIQWSREGDDWKITSIRPRMMDRVPIESLRELRGYAP